MSLYCSIPDCENLPERNGICASHNIAARKAERKALEPPKKKKAIKPRSDKKAIEIKEYSVLRAEYLAKHQYCEIKLLGCLGLASELHHVTTSAKDFTDMNTVMATCRRCHFQVESVLSAAERRKKGLLV